MRNTKKTTTKDLSAESLERLNEFLSKVKKGEIVPFEEKTERARQNLKKTGLIK